MAVTVPTKEPSTIRAGDTLTFSRSIPDYLASDSWTLSYTLISRKADKITFNATADGQDFLVEQTPTVTRTWGTGHFLLVGKVSKAAQSFTIFSGPVEILPDLSQEDNYDDRTNAEKMLETIELMLVGGELSRTQQSYSINGRSFSSFNKTELLMARDKLKGEVRWEKNKGRNRILTRFTRP